MTIYVKLEDSSGNEHQHRVYSAVSEEDAIAKAIVAVMDRVGGEYGDYRAVEVIEEDEDNQ